MAQAEFTGATNLSSSDSGDALAEAIRRYNDLLIPWRIWSAEYQELADYVLPRKNSIQVKRTPGTKRTQKLFDSTAVRAAEMLASSMNGSLTSSALRWFYLETDDQDLNMIDEVRVWLHQVTERMIWEFNRSNFASEVHECYLDLVVFGTACMFEDVQITKEKGFPGLLFQSVPCGRYVLSEGPDGRANTVFRSHSMSSEAIKMMWPGKADEVANVALRPDLPHAVIHGVYPAKNNGAPLLNKWDSIWFMAQQRILLDQKGYQEFPFMCPRWSKVNGETYGRGPTHVAIPDVRSLNKVVEMELKALAKVVDPPIMVLAGDAIGPVRLQPGAPTTVRNMESVKPLMLGIDFKVSNLKSEQLKTSIREMYYSDQLQMPQGPQMTAEEVRVRYELMQRIMGPALGRLESELLKPLIDRTFAIGMRYNIFPPVPTAIQTAQQTGKVTLKIRYEGPLARAQKAADVASIQQLLQMAEPLMQINPKIGDVINFDEAIRETAILTGVPPTVVRDEEDTQAYRDQQQQEAQAQQGPEDAQNMMGAASKAAPLLQALNKAPEPGSPNAKIAQMRGARQAAPTPGAPGGQAAA